MFSFLFTAMLTVAVGYAGWQVLKYLGILILALFGFGVEYVDEEDDEET